jgi:CheY-like chemotaxis protein
MSTKKVLSVGQCFADHGAMRRAFHKHFGAEVVGADSGEEALDLLRKEGFALVLVNRVLDADGVSGLEVLRQIKVDKQAASVPAMLVSNYEDAQRQALAAGAVRGFGKAALGQPAMLATVRPFLEEKG